MNRRDAILSVGGAVAGVMFPWKADGLILRGGSAAAAVNRTNPVGTNLGAGGASDFYFEDFPLTQDLVAMGKFFATTGGAGIINGTLASTDELTGFPTQDWGQFLHATSQTPSWMSGGAFAFGYISRGSGTETITGNNCTISNIVRSGTLVTCDITAPTTGTWGYTVTGGSGCTSCWAYMPAYRANASNQHVPITVANVLAGKPIFTADAINFYKQFPQGLRWLWAQNMWNCQGGVQVAFATNPVAGATSGTLAANSLAPGTYQCFFTPTSTPPGTPTTSTCADVRNITITSSGQTAIDWSGDSRGGLNYGATAITLACSSATRHTAANTPTQGSWLGSQGSYSIEGYPLDLAMAHSVACGNGIYVCAPINDDGTWISAALTDLKNNIPAGIPIDIELADELWNGTGTAKYCFDALALAAFPTASYTQYAAQYLATRLHSIATTGKSIFGARWNTDVRLLMAWQEGNTSVPATALAYYKAQGWNPATDVWSTSVAPYMSPSPALVTTDSIATIQSKAATGAPLAAASVKLEHYSALAKWYGLPGDPVCYESGWDSKALGNTYTNLGAAIVDSGMTPVMTTYWQTVLDYGAGAFFNFEGGCSSSNASGSPLDLFTYDYATLVAGGNPSPVPRVAALQAVMSGYVPKRNVIAKSGDQVDWRNYLDSTTANSFPTFTASSNISPINNFSIGMHVYVPAAATLTIESFFTTNAGTGNAGALNFYVDGVEVASAVSIPLGLNGTSSPAVVLGTHAFTAGHHYIELGTGSFPGTITANMLQVQ